MNARIKYKEQGSPCRAAGSGGGWVKQTFKQETTACVPCGTKSQHSYVTLPKNAKHFMQVVYVTTQTNYVFVTYIPYVVT